MKQKRFLLIFMSLVLFCMPIVVFAEEPNSTPDETPEVDPTPDPTPDETPDETPDPTPEVTTAYLDYLAVDGFELNEVFNKEKKNYTLNVPSNTTSINITATPDSNSEIFTGTGSKTISAITSEFKVVAKVKGCDEERCTTTYTVTVTREKADVSLKSLKVNGYAFQESFSPSVYSYSLEVPYQTEDIVVVAAANSADSSVSVKGAEGLQVGRNTVTVTVSASTGEKQEYTIIVTRLEEEEEPANETSTVTSEDTTKPPVTSIEKKNNNTKYIIVAVVCVLLILLAGLGIFFYIKSSDPAKREAKRKAKEEKKLAKLKEKAGVIEEEIAEDEVPQVSSDELINPEEIEDLEKTKEAPAIDHTDILDGIEDLFDDREEK